MKVVVAIDSLKGSLSSLEAGDAVREGIFRAYRKSQVHKQVQLQEQVPDQARAQMQTQTQGQARAQVQTQTQDQTQAQVQTQTQGQARAQIQVQVRPLADGGEGTVEALTIGMGGTLQKVTVTGPVGQRVEAQYGILQDGRTAVMEMSQAAGITQVTDAERNPLNTTTFGVGEMILDAVKKGCREFIMGIGGSATNDGGIGMLQAFGYGLMDAEDKPVPFGAKGLKVLDHITSDQVDPALSECHFRIACDVTNPLCGENGASAIFGPQKGADAAMILQMDKWLGEYAELAKKSFPKANPLQAGTGAAGGLGFAFLTFTNAVLESGIKIVLDETHLEDYVKDADLVITGEGRLDAQTVMGKGPAGVAAIAKKYRKTVVALAGSIKEDAYVCNDHGIDAFFPILRRIVTLEQAMDKDIARQNMIDTAEQVMRLFLINFRK